MPMELQKIGGWENKEVVMPMKICTNLFELLDEYVDTWITFNEPLSCGMGI